MERGLIAPPTTTGLADLTLLAFLARQHANVDDFMRATTTPDTASEEKRRRYAACRAILDEANGAPLTDPQFHAFLRRLVVLTLDFAIPGHGELESARGRRDAMSDNVNALLPAEWRMPTLRSDLRNRNRERDAERSHQRHPAQFAMMYLFLSEPGVRQEYVDRTRATKLIDACLWVEEQAPVDESSVAQKDFEIFEALVNPANHENTEHQISFHPTAHMQRRAERESSRSRARRDDDGRINGRKCIARLRCAHKHAGRRIRADRP